MPGITVDAVLFDMDGTLIDSTPGVMRAWETFGKQYGFDPAEAAHASHGRRLADTLVEWCKIPKDDLFRLEAEVVRFEQEVIEGGPVILPGVHELVEQLIEGSSPETKSYGWTIVTSATSIYTPKALSVCSIPVPDAGYVTSDDVDNGKPHPDPYLAGAKKCGVDPSKCLVVEDAPSGLRAGHAAGSKTLAVCTSHTRSQIEESGANPDFIVTDLSKVSARWVDGKVVIEIDDRVD
ncbi:HAD-like protein [Stereum hirsutum FP-91666 SS1]|uniref:HAD-like protein n=1 Tax=Stereum hirsutum (strain FP-91666) TaxID=721885 RepID=UPI000440FC5F|nr:HAD-like protein [Stereum hirsutum FP-91666 SS1]EIM92084.1 HAD-like protein [Stereum hirsutum FP-91666 SS1]